ncbi:MAG TPA: DMT family transporter [Bryobacteraceae bacterium]|nr:DMT family transporter [Bryobacteraceae bacterium]
MTFRSTKVVDWFLLLSCNLMWASQFVMVKLVQREMGPLFAVTFPIALSTLLLIILVGRKPGARITKQDLWTFVLLGLAGQLVAQLFITWGVRLAPASDAALLALIMPISTAVMAHFLLGERMTPIRWVSFGLAILGVLVCSGVDWTGLNFGRGYLAGNILIFFSVLGSAFYNAYSKKALERHSPLKVLLYSYYVLLLVLLPVTVAIEPAGFTNLMHYSTTVWVGLAILALFQYFLSMVIFLNVLTRLDATQAALSNYLIPFFGVIIAAAVLHERLTAFMVAGGMLALVSTLLITVWDDAPRQGLAEHENPSPVV